MFLLFIPVMATIDMDNCLTYPVRWEATAIPDINDPVLLGDFNLEYENKSPHFMFLGFSNFTVAGNRQRKCVRVEHESALLPRQSRRRAVLLHLATYNPDKPCRLFALDDLEYHEHLLHIPTRRSNRILTGQRRKFATPQAAAEFFDHVETKKKMLRKRSLVLKFSFKLTAWYRDHGEIVADYTNFESRLVIPRGAPKNSCVHFSVVEFD